MLGLLFAAAIRVACIGDLITQGIGTPQSADKSFPEGYPAFDTFGRQTAKTEVAAGISCVRVPVSGYCTLERK